MTFLSRLFARVDVVVMVDDGKASKQNLNSAKFTFQRRKLLNYDKWTVRLVTSGMFVCIK